MSKWLKLFGFLKKGGEAVKGTIDKSTDFIDKTLESEYISNAIDKAKDATDKVVQKAGEVYENTKQGAEDFIESEQIKDLKDKGKEIFSEVSEKGKEFADKVSEKGKEMVDKAMENETIKSTVETVKEKTDQVADKITQTFDGINEEE